MYTPVDQSSSAGSNFSALSKQQQVQTLNTKAADEAYHSATEKPQESHVAVGILRPDGTTEETHFGKNEPYGAHRVGSVTKTFTTFLALKLCNDGVIKLNTKCGEVIDKEILEAVFQDPEAAAEMTLEQLLSHTAGLEYDDHNRSEAGLNLRTMHERFIHEGQVGNKYKHTSQPGDGIGSYSNAGLAVAAWMLEVAYNKKLKNETPTPFAQIMRDEIFTKVFNLSENTKISPGPGGDVIGAAAGDMTSSTEDLLQVAQYLQQGEHHLANHFGQNWQEAMLAPRDLFGHHGLGCAASAPSIEHAGLNCEIIDGRFRDVTAVVVFPLRKGEPGLVAMADSNALGPLKEQEKFINELKKLAGINVAESTVTDPEYELDFFCPSSSDAVTFRGDAYVVTDVDPFSSTPPEKINCTRNGMKHELVRDSSIDAKDAIGYRDANGKKWMMISKGDRKMIYSDYCLVSKSSETPNLTQPSLEKLKSIEGVYYDKEDDLTYTFAERQGRLYFREGKDEFYPAMYLPEENFWVVSLPAGRKNIKFRFPDDLSKDPLVIVDISKKIQNPSDVVPQSERQPPWGSRKK